MARPSHEKVDQALAEANKDVLALAKANPLDSTPGILWVRIADALDRMNMAHGYGVYHAALDALVHVVRTTSPYMMLGTWAREHSMTDWMRLVTQARAHLKSAPVEPEEPEPAEDEAPVCE
jgi:hypothetical protein